MKKIMFAWLLLLLMAATALAEPQLDAVFADDVSLTSGQDGWFIDFEATEGGTMALELLSGETGEKIADVGAAEIEAGAGRIAWNGLLPDGSAVPAGHYMVGVQMKNFWGEESAEYLLSLEILDGTAQSQTAELTPEAESIQPEQAVSAGHDEKGVPVAASFWDMDPNLYDLENPAHQQAIWDLMMQPITVIDGEQTENIYITNKPGTNRSPYSQNCAGELHGQSQGVNVLEEDTDGDGYVLIEAYTNDGTKTENSFMESIAASRVKGYIKASRLYEVTPSSKYALLVDKLRQKLYVFEDGKIISSLLISSGLNNAAQPYNETPAGEFITVSRVGNFYAGKNTIGRFAIRFNGGTLLHEVLHDVNADGTRNYGHYEPDLGQKASHGCIRIPRRKNAEGINMEWFWSNLELKTKVFIWDDKGRQMYEPELPDENLPLYRNPNNGSNYHLDQNCSGVKEKFLPLKGDFTYGDLDMDEFDHLTPCVYCDAPKTKAQLFELYMIAANAADIEVPEAYKAMFE